MISARAGRRHQSQPGPSNSGTAVRQVRVPTRSRVAILLALIMSVTCSIDDEVVPQARYEAGRSAGYHAGYLEATNLWRNALKDRTAKPVVVKTRLEELISARQQAERRLEELKSATQQAEQAETEARAMRLAAQQAQTRAQKRARSWRVATMALAVATPVLLVVGVVLAQREQTARFAALNLDGDATVELWELNRKTASSKVWTKAENYRAFAEADVNADGGLGPDEYADLAAARGEVPAMVEGAWRAFCADARAFFADVQQKGMRASKFISSVLA